MLSTHIPFLLIVVPKVLAVLLGLGYLFLGYATRLRRLGIGATIAASFALQTSDTYSWPWTIGLLIQVGASVFILFHFRYHGWRRA